MLARVLFGAYLIACACCLVWPGYPLFGNRIEPFVLGLPFSLAWNVGFVVATFAALVLFYLATEREG